jgi:quercetin dioxygenase-like cupin family protein
MSCGGILRDVGEPTVIPPRGGEIIGDAADRRVEILCDEDPLHATWTRFAAGRDGADLHIHHHHTDLFYVLAGELTLRLGVQGEEIPVPAGTLARVPPLVVHGFRNAADTELRYLNFHAPGCGFADYMRGLRDGRRVDFDQYDPPAQDARPASDAVVDAAGEHEAITITEVRGEAAGPRHADADNLHAIYVLEGELTVTAGDRELAAPAGSWVQIPPGTPYSTSGDARYLAVRAPV